MLFAVSHFRPRERRRNAGLVQHVLTPCKNVSDIKWVVDVEGARCVREMTMVWKMIVSKLKTVLE